MNTITNRLKTDLAKDEIYGFSGYIQGGVNFTFTLNAHRHLVQSEYALH